MKRVMIAAALAGAAWLGLSAPASAQIEYPWCIITGGREAGVMSCGYVSWNQCMQTRVATDMCVPNPRYQGRRR